MKRAILAAAAVLLALLGPAAPARTDDVIDPSVVCGMVRMGLSPGEIAQDIHDTTHIPVLVLAPEIWRDTWNC